MITGSISAATPSTSTRRRTAPLAFSCFGSSIRRAISVQATIRPMPMISPGTMPARNSWLIDVPVTTP